MRFQDLNALINPTGQPIYVPLWNEKPQGRIAGYTFRHITQLMFTDQKVEVGLILPQDVYVIEILGSAESIQVEQLIKNLNEQVFVVRKGPRIQIYARGIGVKDVKEMTTPIGVRVKVISASKINRYIILPYKHPTFNTSATLKKMSVAHGDTIGELPYWLKPLPKAKRQSIRLPIMNSQVIHSLLPHIEHLKKNNFTKVREVIELISNNLCETPIQQGVIEQMLASQVAVVDEEQFFEDNFFLHHKMADYIMERCHVKKAERGTLFHYNDLTGIYEENEEYLKSMITRTLPILRDTQKNEVIKYLTSFLELEKAKFDADPYIVTFKNCRVDVLNMTVEPLSPEHLDTIQLGVEYNPDAYHPIVDEFMGTASCETPEVEQLLYEALGYSFLKTVHLAKSFILVGEGRNGKSTYLELIDNIVGEENSTSIDMKSMGSNFRVSNLQGKLVSTAGDISSTPMSDSDLFKSISSGDRILVEKKYKDAVEEKLWATLFFAANKLPRTPDTSFGFYRRFCIIPFNAVLTSVSKMEGERFKNKLLSREALEYAAFRAIQAIHRVLNTTNDFIEPQVCKDMLNQYRIENSSPLQWSYEQFNAGNSYENKELHRTYADYKIWCEINGFRPHGLNRFVDEISTEFGFHVANNEQNKHIIKRNAPRE